MSIFQGRTALVTGAAKRIGRAVALALADAGADVIVHYNRSAQEARSVASEATDLGVRAWTVAADLSEPAAGTRLFQQAVETAGPVDILINSASIFPRGTLLESSPDDFVTNLTVNAVSPLMICRALAAQEIPGSAIVNFLDTRVLDYDRKHVPYHVSKRAFFSITRMLADELAPTTRVNGVAPGLILPPPGEDESYLARMSHTNPLNAHGSVADITRAVLFLLQSTFVTGQVIYVDGGRHIKGRFYGS